MCFRIRIQNTNNIISSIENFNIGFTITSCIEYNKWNLGYPASLKFLYKVLTKLKTYAHVSTIFMWEKIIKCISCINVPVCLLLLLSSFSETLCDPIDGSPLGSSVPGILQARILEWVATSFSNA